MSVNQQLSEDTKSKKKNLKFIEANHDQGWNSRKTLLIKYLIIMIENFDLESIHLYFDLI